MNLETKVSNIMDHLNDPILLRDYNCITVLDISEPLMFVLNQFDEYYLAYLMQHKTIFYSNTKADVSEMLFSISTFEEIKELLQGRIAIKDALYKKDWTYKIGKIGNKIYPPNLISDVETIENKIPLDGVFFDEKLPNKVQLNVVLQELEVNHNFYDSFNLAPEKILKRTTSNVKISKNFLIVEIDYELEIIDSKVGITNGD
ncbi:hypothetical protein [Paenibacillus amylolyticus]|uniref:hypothetical protein n=1 Tax=Paenibacillus amylolyticus TaxID=1451 RepID=UPI00201D320C|nr:hypothetical protein [Paenibacillus amylolyticus]MCL6663398.1 hypothetical protein [Paenibacillus amylolyticus]